MIRHDPSYAGGHFARALVAEHRGDALIAQKEFTMEKNSGARPTQTSKDLTFNSNDLPADALGRREVQCGADAVSLVRVDGRGVALDSWADPGLSAITGSEVGAAGLGSTSCKSATANIFILIDLKGESTGFIKDLE